MRTIFTMTLATLVVAAAAPANAQTGPVPAPGMTGVTFSVGAALPSDDFLANGPLLGIGIERYSTRRVSVRGLLTGSWLDVKGHAFDGTVRPVTITGNVVYNWEHGQWHPYATAGAGLYHYRFEENGLTDSANKFGVNLGGGVEWFFARRNTITGELLLHLVPGSVRSSLTDYDTGFWTLAAGYKMYF